MKLHRQFLRQAWAIFGPLKWRMLLVLIGIMLVQTLSLVGPYIQGTILDKLSHGRSDFINNIIDNVAYSKTMTQTYWLIALAGAVWIFSQWALQFPREMYENEKVDYDIDERACDQTMVQMTSLSVGQHNTFHSGMKQSIINRGQTSMTALVNMFVYEIVPIVSRVLIVTVAMCWLSVAMGLVVLLAVAIFVWLTLRINHSFKGDLKKLEKMWNQESKFRGEIIQHISHVLVNAQENKARAEADAKYEETVTFAKPLWRRFMVLTYLRSTIIIVARVAVMALGARYIYSGRYTFGTIVVFWGWSNDAFNSVNNVGNLHRQIIRMWTSIQRYCEFLNMETDVKVISNPVVLNPVQGRIEVRNLSFMYDSRMAISQDEEDGPKPKEVEKSKRPALIDVSFIIEQGETVAIVGESGSGKTTLANMLVRSSDPTSGQILIDGQDLRVLDLQKFRSRVGIVEQNVPLFDRSIRENILYGLDGKAKDVTEEELQRIAQISQISRFSHKLENGFDTLIGERGIKLSGGERQRVGIARALIKDPAIIIFDEATSSLDAKVEFEIREAIRAASKGRTTILIAHRFSTIRYANRIIVMDEGRISGQGTHEQLLLSCEPYRQLVRHQMAEN